MEEYRGVRKSLQDLVEGQKRNMAQLERIGGCDGAEMELGRRGQKGGKWK